MDDKVVNMEEVKASKYSYTHKFSTPFTYEGKTYEEITFDWGKLTGEDSLSIEAEMNALGKMIISPEFSGEYLIRMAALASSPKIGADVLQKLSLKDFNKIRSAARSFLLKSEQ